MDNKRHYLFLYKQEFDMKEITGMAWQAISVLEKKYNLYDINNTEKKNEFNSVETEMQWAYIFTRKPFNLQGALTL